MDLFLSSSAFPARSLGFTILNEIICKCDRFFNPTIEVVTFRLRNMVHPGCVFCLGHERQDLLSPCNGMDVCTD